MLVAEQLPKTKQNFTETLIEMVIDSERIDRVRAIRFIDNYPKPPWYLKTQLELGEDIHAEIPTGWER